jgi:hypothetical protein
VCYWIFGQARDERKRSLNVVFACNSFLILKVPLPLPKERVLRDFWAITRREEAFLESRHRSSTASSCSSDSDCEYDAAYPVSVNIVFSFRRRGSVLLLSAYERLGKLY